MQTEIIDSKYYSLSEVAKNKWIPGARSYPTLHAIVLRELALPESKRILNALIFGEGRSTTIRILGKNIKKKIKEKGEIEYTPHPTKGKKRPDIAGEKHPNWKGEGAGYNAKHKRIKKKLPKTCEACKKEEPDIGWANKDHKYSDDPKDYTALCSKCHAKHDKDKGLRYKK